MAYMATVSCFVEVSDPDGKPFDIVRSKVVRHPRASDESWQKTKTDEEAINNGAYEEELGVSLAVLRDNGCWFRVFYSEIKGGCEGAKRTAA